MTAYAPGGAGAVWAGLRQRFGYDVSSRRQDRQKGASCRGKWHICLEEQPSIPLLKYDARHEWHLIKRLFDIFRGVGFL